MAFFSRTWDEAFPADTQAANLLGQDIRDFKEDIRERMASISGDLADRPAVGDMITGWGAYGGNGMLYFATDTGNVYQWSGAAWVDVTGTIGNVAGALKTTGANVDVSLAVPPTVGKVLRATDATHATWQTVVDTNVLLVVGAITIQRGIDFVAAGASSLITFPVAFAAQPTVVLTADINALGLGLLTIGGASGPNFTIFNNVTDAGGTPVGVFVHWVALGQT